MDTSALTRARALVYAFVSKAYTYIAIDFICLALILIAVIYKTRKFMPNGGKLNSIFW